MIPWEMSHFEMDWRHFRHMNVGGAGRFAGGQRPAYSGDPGRLATTLPAR